MDVRCSAVYLFSVFNFIWRGKLVLYQYCRRAAIKIIYSRDLIRDFLNKIIVLINITL